MPLMTKRNNLPPMSLRAKRSNLPCPDLRSLGRCAPRNDMMTRGFLFLKCRRLHSNRVYLVERAETVLEQFQALVDFFGCVRLLLSQPFVELLREQPQQHLARAQGAPRDLVLAL